MTFQHGYAMMLPCEMPHAGPPHLSTHVTPFAVCSENHGDWRSTLTHETVLLDGRLVYMLTNAASVTKPLHDASPDGQPIKKYRFVL